LKQLESCHIGSRETKDHIVRRSSLPVVPCATVSIPKAQASWFQEPLYTTIPARGPHSQSAPVPRWDDSRPLAPTNSANMIDWRPLRIDSFVSKKRRLDGEFVPGQPGQRLSQSSQISPRTTPLSALPTAENSVRNLAPDASEMVWAPELPSLPGNQPSTDPASSHWSDFNWNIFNTLDTVSQRPQNDGQTVPMDSTVPSNHKQATNPLHQPRIGMPAPRNQWQRNLPQASGTSQIQHRPAFESTQRYQSFSPSVHQAGSHYPMSQRPPLPIALSSPCPPASIPLQNFDSIFQAPSNNVTHRQGTASQWKQIVAPPSPTHNASQSVRAAPSDLLRKPSLYKIPAWSSPAGARVTQIQRPTSQFQSRHQGPNTDRIPGFHSNMNLSVLGPPSNQIQPDKLPFRNPEGSPHIGSMNPLSSTPGYTAAEKNTFEIPRARTSRRHCPNL
jgi:hypothetical protein